MTATAIHFQSDTRAPLHGKGARAKVSLPAGPHDKGPRKTSTTRRKFLADRETRYIALDHDATIAEAFMARATRSPNAPAYKEFDAKAQAWRDYTWREMADLVARMRAGFRREGLQPGDRIAIMLKNGVSWVLADQGAYAHGLVPVPLFVDDRPDNVAFILADAEVKLLIIDGEEHWKRLKTVQDQLGGLQRIVTLRAVADENEPRLVNFDVWLPASADSHEKPPTRGSDLATIVYTSGTTGRPKGVMLTHRNMLSNAQSGLKVYQVYPEDIFLSFLPLSHMFERTCGYYLNIVSGASVAFARSVPQLAEDLRTVRPTILMSVPRIFERFLAVINDQLKKASPLKKRLFDLSVEIGWARFEYQQSRGAWQPNFLLWPILKPLVADKILARLGGRLRLAISGGAALSPAVSRVFVGLGLPICQGYGLTEASPLLAVNLLERNKPSSVGLAVPDVETRLGENNVLLVRGPNIMQGYWKNPEATRAILSEDGWLNTGDQVSIDGQGFITITGRIKEIIVLGNGEKVPPVDMELAVQMDPLFEQVLIVGEAQPFLTALVVLNDEEWARFAEENQLSTVLIGENRDKAEKMLVKRLAPLVKRFPGYAQVRRLTVVSEKWTIDNGFMTPTLKLKRNLIVQKYQAAIDDMYKGHAL
jgi:long-chain acyl-CoA synthetase